MRDADDEDAETPRGLERVDPREMDDPVGENGKTLYGRSKSIALERRSTEEEEEETKKTKKTKATPAARRRGIRQPVRAHDGDDETGDAVPTRGGLGVVENVGRRVSVWRREERGTADDIQGASTSGGGGDDGERRRGGWIESRGTRLSRVGKVCEEGRVGRSRALEVLSSLDASIEGWRRISCSEPRGGIA